MKMKSAQSQKNITANRASLNPKEVVYDMRKLEECR